MESVMGIGDTIHHYRKGLLEWLEDNFELFGFWIHKHQNTSLIFTFIVMWVLATLSLYASPQPDHVDQFRFSSKFSTSYQHFMDLKPLIGDNMGTGATSSVIFTAGSNSNDGNVLTANRVKDVLHYHDMISRGITVCRHKSNGKVKVPCDHRMARVYNYKNDCARFEPFERDDDKLATLYQRVYDPLSYHKIVHDIKDNYDIEWTDAQAKYVQAESIPCDTCKIADISGTYGHCASERTPFKQATLSNPDNPTCCKCMVFSFGHPVKMEYKGFKQACERCWDHELDEPMPKCSFLGGLLSWNKCSIFAESFGSCVADGKVYESANRYKIRSGVMTDKDLRVWLRKLYDDPHQDIEKMVGGLPVEKIKLECGTRAEARQKCVKWKQDTGHTRAISLVGIALCLPLKKYEKCVEDNMVAKAIVMSYTMGLKKWGKGQEVLPSTNPYIAAFEDELIAIIVGKSKDQHHHQALNNVKVYLSNSNAMAKEIGRVIFGAMLWYILGGSSVALVCFFFMGRIDWVDGRGLLGLFALFSATSCLFGAFGLQFLFGQFSTLFAIIYLYLVVVAVAVDDMLIIVDAFERVVPPKELQVRDERIAWKISQAMREVGPSITMTTLTTCMAFLVGTDNPFPYMQYVAWAGFYCFALDFYYQLCFFVPLLIKDERRRLKSRWGCAPCFCEWPDEVLPTTDEERTTTKRGYIMVFCEKYILPAVKDWRWTAVLSTILATTFFLSCAAIPTVRKNSELGVPLQKRYPSASYASEFLNVYEENWGKKSIRRAFVYVKDYDMANAGKRRQLRLFLDHLHYDLTVKERYGEQAGQESHFWNRKFFPTIFEKFHNDNQCPCDTTDGKCAHPSTGVMVQYQQCDKRGSADKYSWGPGMLFKDPEIDAHWPANYIKRYRPTYREQLLLLLDTPGLGQPFKDYIWINDNDGKKVSFVIRTSVKFFVQDGITAMNFYIKSNEVYKSYGLGDGFVYVETIDLSERAYRMYGWVWDLIVSVLAGIFVSLIFFMPFWASLFATLMVLVLEIHVWGMIYVFDLKVGNDMFAGITITCGICVDEITHSLFHLVNSYGTVDDRLYDSVVVMGSSVIKGALSTIVGVSFISGAAAGMWKAYFIVTFTLCIFGSICGVVLVPSLLRIFMSDNPHPEDLYAMDDMEFNKEKQQVELGSLDNDGVSIVEDCTLNNEKPEQA